MYRTVQVIFTEHKDSQTADCGEQCPHQHSQSGQARIDNFTQHPPSNNGNLQLVSCEWNNRQCPVVTKMN